MVVQKIEPELLESLYHGSGYTLQDIADIFGCSYGTILNRMVGYGISCRSRGCMVTDFVFNDRQKEIFEGCMLGDGALEWQMSNCHFRNGDVHEEYLLWLQKQLGVEDISSVKPRYSDGFAYLYELRTRVIPSIQDEYKRWCPNGAGTQNNYNHKIIPKDIELSQIMLLFWYLGDGSYSIRDDAVTFGNFLVFEDWIPLSKKVSKVLDVDSGVSITKHSKDNNGIQRYRLCLNKPATNKFFDLVDDLGFDIPECYQYKFGR